MKVFISWSKEPSKTVAKTLNDWLPSVIQAVDPWMSEEDIKAGSRWHSEISKQLATTSFGIVCVTLQNQHEPWIQFEAGALAKTVEGRLSKEASTDESYVVPYLIDMAKSDLSGPLTAFQAIEAKQEGTKRLVGDINRALAAYGGKALPEATLNKSFERAWPELEATLKGLPIPTTQEAKRKPEDILAEILDVVRDTNRRIGEPETREEDARNLFKLYRTNLFSGQSKADELNARYITHALNDQRLPVPAHAKFTNKASFVVVGKQEALTKFQETLEKPLLNSMDAVEKSLMDRDADGNDSILLIIESTSDKKFEEAKTLIYKVARSLKLTIHVV